MQAASPPFWQRLAAAVAAVFVATILRATFFHGLGEQSPFITFYPAIVIAAFYGGWSAGLLALGLSLPMSFIWLRDPIGLQLPHHEDLPRLTLFIVVSLMIVWIGDRAFLSGHEAAKALDKLENSERRIGDMLDSLSEAFVLLDHDWRFVYVNRACEQMYGADRQQLLGHTLWEFFPHVNDTETERQFRIAMEQRRPVQFELLSPRLGYWVASGAFPVADGISIYVQNIDDRKRAEDALRESESRYRRLVETAQEGIWTIDGNSRTTYVNRSLAEMLGYTPAEMQGRPVYEFIDPDALPEALVHTERCKQGIAQRDDYHLRRKDGSDFFAYVSTTPIMGPSGEYQGALAMVLDVTERRQVETERKELLLREQKARAEAEAANRRKDQFLAVLSHELRTPLTPVIARLALMKREPNLSGPLKTGLEMIRRNVELESRLIEDLLDMTRLARGQLKLHPERIDAHDAVRAAVDIYQGEIAARHQTIHVELDAREHFVFADGVRLQQVFWNLVGNAVKYTPQGGSITVRSSDEANGGPAKLRVQFIDNGIGIAPDLMPRLFDPFEQGEQTLTRRFGGLGLGLSISRTLIQMQGGTLTAESAGKGAGSTFTVELPTVPSPVAMPTEMKPAAPAEAPGQAAVQRILLVDDNEDTLRVMARLLRLNGHQVTTAESVQAALLAAAEPFDLLITDIGLPDGTGWELMRELRRRGPVRGIALSGFSMDEDVRRSHEVGFIEHLCKPIMPDDLEEAIRRAATNGS